MNVATLTSAIQSRLQSHPTLNDVRDIVRGDYLNTDPGFCPWIGVYRTANEYDPKTLGYRVVGWKSTVSIDLAIQTSVALDGAATETALEDLIDRVMTVLLEDNNYGGMQARIVSARVTYDYQQADSSTLDFQMATLSLTFDART